MSPSSSGPGYRVFIPAAGVQIPLGTQRKARFATQCFSNYNGRVAQLGEHPAYIRKVTGSSPVPPNCRNKRSRGLVWSMTLDCHSRDRRFKSGRLRQLCAEIAQSVEHSPEKAGVPSSNLGLGTIFLPLLKQYELSAVSRQLSAVSTEQQHGPRQFCPITHYP